jgi:ABC-2 type transport system permease protein
MGRRMVGLWPLTVANSKSFLRNRAALFWTFAFPVIFIVLFGSIFSGRPTTFDLGWVDEDHSAASERLRGQFGDVSVLVLTDTDQQTALDKMRDGSLDAVLVVPAGLGTAMTPSGAGPQTPPAAPFQLVLYTDPSSQTSATTVQQIVSTIVGGINLQVSGTPPALGVANQALQTESIGAAAYFVPSILAMALMQLGIFAAIPLVAQREKGILKRLNATPLSRSTLVSSNVFMRLLIAIMQTFIIVGIGAVLFGVAIVGSVALAALFVILGALTFLALGYVIASYARTEESANALTSVVQFPLMFLSGIFFPIAFMPQWLQPVAALMPLTYLGDGLRQTMVGGAAFAPLWVDFLVLGVWLVVSFLISARFFRWQ